MDYLMDPTVITILLLIGIILLIVWWDRSGTSREEIFRISLPGYEDALRRRGLLALIPLLRSYRNDRREDSYERLQEVMTSVGDDEAFTTQIFMPLMVANMGTVVNTQTLLVQLDMELRTKYGYRLKPIHMTTYGIRPETVLHATAEENDVCMREVQTTSLAVGKKTYATQVESETNND